MFIKYFLGHTNQLVTKFNEGYVLQKNYNVTTRYIFGRLAFTSVQNYKEKIPFVSKITVKKV